MTRMKCLFKVLLKCKGMPTLLFGIVLLSSGPVFSSANSARTLSERCAELLTQKVRPFVLRTLEQSVNRVYAMWPRRRPSPAQLENCKIVSHRGAHEYATENTLEAFELCRNQKIWGIEFDIRWTADNEPILLHDEDAGRTFGRPDIIPSQMTLVTLQRILPQLPSLAQVVEAFGNRFHFMIELKEPLTPEREARLLQVLGELQPVTHYHLLSLKPEFFNSLNSFPRQSLLIVSELNARSMSEIALRNNWGGITGHYVLLDDEIQALHQAHGQEIGTGFVDSKNTFYRAVRRNVRWIFTNRPLALSSILEELNN